MFLTKKGNLLAVLMAVIYAVLGGVMVALYVWSCLLDSAETTLLVFGVVMCLLSVPVFFVMRKAFGKGNVIRLGNKLVCKELHPAEFIRRYEEWDAATDLVIKNPSLDVLQLVLLAYDLLDDKENMNVMLEKMAAVANEKKQPFVKLLKTSYLFSCGRTEEAEALFVEVQQQTLDIVCAGLVNTILKTDRAMAMGDYTTVELYCHQTLQRTFPKLNMVSKLVLHHLLAQVYEKKGDTQQALLHYRYCVTYGGETAIRTSATEMLRVLSVTSQGE